MSKKQFIASIEDLHQNPLEAKLKRWYKSDPYSLKLIDVYPVYCFEGQRYICYRKILREQEKLLIIQEHINSSTYKWKENTYRDIISLYYFMSIKKNQEYDLPWNLKIDPEAISGSWEVWGVLKDGTILTPYESRIIMKLLKSNVIVVNRYDSYYLNNGDDYEDREDYLGLLCAGAFDE